MGPLPSINVSIEKRWPRVNNGQQYPLSCCAHFRFLHEEELMLLIRLRQFFIRAVEILIHHDCQRPDFNSRFQTRITMSRLSLFSLTILRSKKEKVYCVSVNIYNRVSPSECQRRYTGLTKCILASL